MMLPTRMIMSILTALDMMINICRRKTRVVDQKNVVLDITSRFKAPCTQTLALQKDPMTLQQRKILTASYQREISM